MFLVVNDRTVWVRVLWNLEVRCEVQSIEPKLNQIPTNNALFVQINSKRQTTIIENRDLG